MFSPPPMLLMQHTSHMSVNQAAHRSPCCLLFNSIDQTHVCTEACIMPGLTLWTWQHLEVSFGFNFFSSVLFDLWSLSLDVSEFIISHSLLTVFP